jgi:hypothetical protein
LTGTVETTLERNRIACIFYTIPHGLPFVSGANAKQRAPVRNSTERSKEETYKEQEGSRTGKKKTMGASS